MINYLKVLLLACLFVKSYSQDNQFKNFTIEDGLPTSELYDVEFDNQGRAWFASDRGVSRYDGYTFTNFGREDGLPDNTIFEIIKEDDTDRLWFFTYNGKIAYYENEKFTSPEVNDSLQIKNWFEQIIKLDSFTYILITKETGSVSKTDLNQTKQRLQKVFIYDFFKNKRKEINIDSIVEVNKNKKLIYLEKYKIIIDLDFATIYHFEEEKEYTHYKIPVTGKGSLDRGSEGYKLIKINKTAIIAQTKINHSTSCSLIDNELFISSSRGIIEIHPFSFKQQGLYFKEHFTTEIQKGPNGNYWITTQNNGVFKAPTFDIKTFEQIPKDLVPTKLKIFNGNLFITCRNGNGMFAFDENLNLNYTLKDKRVLAYPSLLELEGKLITCNLSNISPLNKSYNYEKGKIRNSPYNINPINRSMIGLKDGRFIQSRNHFIGKHLKLIKRHSDDSWEELPIFFNMKTENISCFIENHNGHIIYNSPNGTFKINNTKVDTLTSSPILELNFKMTEMQNYGKKGILFASLGSGLMYMYEDESNIQSITEDDGLSSNLLNCIYQQGDSIMWVGTNTGLNKINYKLVNNQIIVDSIDIISKNDGLSSDYILDIALWNEEIWITTKNGINYFNKDISVKDYTLPKVFFNSITCNEDSLNFHKVITLEHEENDIKFNYTGVYYNKDALKKFYRYKLSNSRLDTTWIYTNNREVQYSDLNSGDYTFIVDAQNSEGMWTTNAAVFNFTIKKHFTELIWIRVLLVLLILGILLYLYRLKANTLIKRERQQQALKEAELKLKAAELNALRNQMNPHFIYNALNSIQNFIFQDNPEKANYLLSRFSTLMRSSLDLSRLEYITIDQEIDFLENYLELEKMRFDERFNYQFIVSDKVYKHKVPPLLLQPIIENCIKHGFQEGNEFMIIINIFENDDHVIMEVKDNGRGINTKDLDYMKTKRPSALKIITDRITIINSNTIDKATFKIKNLDNSEGQGKGTIAEFKLPIIR